MRKPFINEISLIVTWLTSFGRGRHLMTSLTLFCCACTVCYSMDSTRPLEIILSLYRCALRHWPKTVSVVDINPLPLLLSNVMFSYAFHRIVYQIWPWPEAVLHCSCRTNQRVEAVYCNADVLMQLGSHTVIFRSSHRVVTTRSPIFVTCSHLIGNLLLQADLDKNVTLTWNMIRLWFYTKRSVLTCVFKSALTLQISSHVIF